MTGELEVIDAHAEEVAPQHSATLFKTDDPVEVVEKASQIADALKGVLKKQGLTARIGGKEHVLVEGWTTLGSMLGVVPVCEWTRKVEGGWEARVEARTLDGRVVGAAEAECLRDERRWKTADDYALRSMSQTRATSKALRGPLGFIVTLAGYAATPEEEMPRDTPAPPAAVQTITMAAARNLALAAWSAGCQDKLQRAASHAHGGDVGDCSTEEAAIAAMARLTAEESVRVRAWVEKKRAEGEADA